jgi:hypothetical protein
MHQGSCLCGGVRYTIEGSLRRIMHCHCRQCRKAHGAAFATYVTVGRARFHLVSGADLVRTFASSEPVLRSFCGRCGSSLFWADSRAPEVIDVALGTLDDEPENPPFCHVFVGSRAGWVGIHDDLPQYPENAPSVPEPDR